MKLLKMINKPSISVIVPMYNAEKCIIQCLKSITTQDLENIEIIVVNDASTDSSLNLCLAFAKGDERIKIIDKKINEGGALARKSGLDVASGIYICHVDSDDWLANGALKKMYNVGLKHDVDIVVGNAFKVLDKYGFIKQKIFGGPSHITDKLIMQKEFREEYYKGFFGIYVFSVVMWGRIYKKSFLDTLEVKFIDSSSYLVEDIIYNIQVFPEAKSTFFMSEFVYFYRFGGFTNKFNKMFMFSFLKMYNIKKEMIKTYNYEQISPFIKYELKNCLMNYIEMLIRFKPCSNEDILSEIDVIINNEQFLEVREQCKQGTGNDEFVTALIDNNIHKMYTIIEEKYKKKRVLNFIKKVSSFVLN
jgi:glycosyltransferase involved in cell wall biosynthesis